MRKLSLLSLLCISAVFVYAQERVVSGQVTDDSGESLPGVNVIVKGTSTGTVTDVSGGYRVSISDRDTLEFSFVGLETQQVIVGGRSAIDVQMKAASKMLMELVFVAYGQESKRTLTGAVAAIDASTIQRQQVTSITRSLSGTLAGVTAITGSGQPGVAPTIRIRGVASIDSGNDPLIVLDGSVYSSTINTIPASDVQSISVLKDASAAALYGSRAANGVIVITTKKGKFSGKKLGKPNFNFSMTMGTSERSRRDYGLVDAKTAMRMEWEALRNDAVDAEVGSPGEDARDGLLGRIRYNPFGGDQPPIDANGDFTSNTLLWDTDWEKALFTNTASRNEYNLGVSGGGRRVSYFLGGSILHQDGQLDKSDFKRYTARLNLEVKLTDWLLAGFRQSISSSSQNNPTQSGSSYSNAVQWIRTVSNIYPIYRRDENGELVRDNTGELIYDLGVTKGKLNGERPVLSPGNTVGLLRLNEALFRRFNSITNFTLEANFLKDFTAKTNYQLNKYVLDGFEYNNPTVGSAVTVGGRIRRRKDITTEWTWTNSLSWHKTYDQHSIEVLGLQEMYSYSFEKTTAQGTGIPFPGLYELSSTATPETVVGYTNAERIFSLMARLKYNYRNKYFFESSYRLDQSSRFSPETRSGNFYSVSGSWLLSEEPFLNSSVMNFMKIRISYGELGNNRIEDSAGNDLYFPYLTTYETGYDQPGVSGIYPGGLAERKLTWESVATLNVGLDFGLFQDRLSGSIDLYSAVTRNLVTALTTIPSRGVRRSGIVQNIGDVTNSGIELALAGDVIKTPNFRWNLSVNIALEKNVITKFPEKERISGSKKLVEGRSIYDFWIRDYAGVNSGDGKPLWWADSLAEDGTVVVERFKLTDEYDDAGRYFVGTALPWGKGGVSSRMDFKGFDFSVLMNFSLGGKILDYDYAELMHGGRRAGQQYSADIVNRWQQAGDVTDVPRLSSDDRGSSRSTRFLFDATYARMRNITLGYSLPASVLDKLGGVVKSFRIFFSGDNLFTFFGRQGLDPEQNVAGTTNNRSAVMKTYSGGLELKF